MLPFHAVGNVVVAIEVNDHVEQLLLGLVDLRRAGRHLSHLLRGRVGEAPPCLRHRRPPEKSAAAEPHRRRHRFLVLLLPGPLVWSGLVWSGRSIYIRSEEIGMMLNQSPSPPRKRDRSSYLEDQSGRSIDRSIDD